MKTVIYLDELLLVNFVAAAALLLAAGLIAGCACTGLRLVAGAGAAACSALILLAPELPFWLSLLYKFGTAYIIVRLTYGPHGPRGLLRLGAWYLLLNLMLTGAVSALALRGGPVSAQANNLAAYLELSPGVLLFSVAGVYLLLRVMLFCFGRTRTAAFPAVLVLPDTEIPVQAFYDTGFSVEDPLSGRPVVLVRYTAVRSGLPPLLREYLDVQLAAGTAAKAAAAAAAGTAGMEVPAPDPSLRVRFISCGTVAGSRLLPAVPAQALRRQTGGRTCQQKNLLAAFCGEELPDAEWSVLFGADVAGGLELDGA